MLRRSVAVAGPTPFRAFVRVARASWGYWGEDMWGVRLSKAAVVVALTSSAEFWRIREGRNGRYVP